MNLCGLWGKPIIKMDLLVVELLNYVQLFYDSLDCSCQASLFMGFPGQEYWSGLLFPSSGDLP